VSGYKIGRDRAQVALFPERLDDYVGEDNEVRVIEEFVEGLDLVRLGIARAIPARTGTPGYDPRDLLKLYVYGYLNRVRSSRRLERECHRNVEVIWLLRGLRPDHWTIAAFRKANVGALKEVFREFTALCRELDLFGRELTFIDGTKIRAVNGRDRNYTEEGLKKLVPELEKRIQAYLQELEQQDAAEVGTPEAGVLKEKLERLRARKTRCEGYQKQMAESGERQVSLTDPESRLMKARGDFDVCYNAQIAVDPKHHLITAQDVTNEVTDLHQLAPMAKAAKEALEVERLDAGADMGYHNGPQVEACGAEQVTAYVPMPQTSPNEKKGLFTKADFRYAAERDAYRCPNGAWLPFGTETQVRGSVIRYYRNGPACRSCPLQAKCTKSKSGVRRISRTPEEPWIEEMEKRVQARPELQLQRKCVVEHPFGTMKRALDFGYFLLKGLEKVRGEFSLMALTYNLRRVINLLGVECLLEVLRRRREARQGALAAA
jgi:transposase